MYNKKQTRLNKFVKQRARENQVRKGTQSRITDFFGNAGENEHTIEVLNTYANSLIKGFQINNQKRGISMEKLSSLLSKTKDFVVLGQEPSSYGYNVCGLNKFHTLIQAPVHKPRAYLYCHKDLNAWPVDSLCSRDVAACIIDTNTKPSKKLLVVSIYWDGTHEDPPPEIELAMKMARDDEMTIYVGTWRRLQCQKPASRLYENRQERVYH